VASFLRSLSIKSPNRRARKSNVPDIAAAHTRGGLRACKQISGPEIAFRMALHIVSVARVADGRDVRRTQEIDARGFDPSVLTEAGIGMAPDRCR
jgi:hypothetical protein